MRTESISFADAEMSWLKSKALSEVAQTAYRGEVERLSLFCVVRGRRTLSRVRADDWSAYVDCLSTDRTVIDSRLKPLKPSSALQAIRITRSFLLHCAERHWIGWDPLRVGITMPNPAVEHELANERHRLPEDVRVVLSSPPFAADERQARRHFVWALGFWGALTPRDLAPLKVGDLQISAHAHKGKLVCRGREHPVILPAELCALWVQYREQREAASTRVATPRSALIANLRSGEPLSAWSIWSLMQETDETARREGPTLNPRTLRTVYADITTRTAWRDIACVRGQMGRTTENSADLRLPSRRQVLNALHEHALADLRK